MAVKTNGDHLARHSNDLLRLACRNSPAPGALLSFFVGFPVFIVVDLKVIYVEQGAIIFFQANYTVELFFIISRFQRFVETVGIVLQSRIRMSS